MKKNTKLEKHLFQVICNVLTIIKIYFDAKYKTSISIKYLGTTRLLWSIDQTCIHIRQKTFFIQYYLISKCRKTCI